MEPFQRCPVAALRHVTGSSASVTCLERVPICWYPASACVCEWTMVIGQMGPGTAGKGSCFRLEVPAVNCSLPSYPSLGETRSQRGSTNHPWSVHLSPINFRSPLTDWECVSSFLSRRPWALNFPVGSLRPAIPVRNQQTSQEKSP